MVFGPVDVEEEPEEAAVPGGELLTRRAFRATQGAAFKASPEQASDIEARTDAFLQRSLLSQEEDREVESYPAGDINALTLRTRANNPDPNDPDQEPAFMRSTANFLFGDEMAIMGVKWDQDGMTWKAETAQEMWSDHPVMSSVALAGIAFPFVGALRKSAKVGKLATLIAPGTELGIVGKTARTIGILPESLLKHGDDWSKLGDELLDVVDEDAVALGAKTQRLKYFDDDFAAVVKAEPDPAKRLEMMGGRKRLQEILLESDKRSRMKELRATVESGNGTQAQIVQYALQKRFANAYFDVGNRINKEYVRNMNEFWDNAKLDELFIHDLDPEDHLLYYKFLNDKHDPADFAKLAAGKQQYFQRTRDRYWQHQRNAVESGFITPETAEFIGKAHVAAIYKKTDLSNVADVSGGQRILERGGIIRHYPKLQSPTLNERKKTLDQVIDAAANGELVTHIEDVHRTSIVKDEMLHVGYKLMRDVALRAGDSATNRYAIKAEAFDALNATAKNAWISLDDLPGKGVSARVKRMVAKSLGKNVDEIDRLPYVHQNVIDELFDPEGGAMIAGHNAANAISLLTAMHKPAKTVFNLPSHFQNIVSNLLYFMPMAGVNPFKGDVITDMRRANQLVWGVAKEIAAKEDLTSASILASREALLDIAKKGNVDTLITTNAGTRLDLIDEMMDPRVRQMIEDQSFDNAEGFSAIHKFYDALEKKGKEAYLDNAVAGLAKVYVRTVQNADKILEKTIKTPLLKRMSAAYLAEDMSPKLATYMQFRKRGLSIEQSVMMVSRKFPQYKTVGKSIAGARRYAFPWITFPAEVTRIMRNNMVDRPLASMMWFQAAGLQQATMSGIGYAPTDLTQVQEAREGAPFWANKPSTVITTAEGQGVVGGGFTGASAGALVGGLVKGPLGFAVGAAAGAVTGAGLGHYGADGEDSLRAWTLDFLPHSAVLPQTYEVHMDPGSNMVKEALKTSPIEPLSVMMPLLRLVMGEDEYGQEIVAESGPDYVAKAAVQTFGMITPPWIQKYGLRVGAPDKGMFGLDRVSTMTLSGTAGAIAGHKLLGMPGAVAGAAIGTTLGSQVDTSRFEEDLGLRTNTRTGERGNPIFDVLFTSATGLGKSWKADPSQKAFNDKMREDNLKTFRGSLKRKLADAAINGDEERWKALMQDLFITYTQQYDDPRQAQAKFSASMEDLLPQLRRNPQYKRYSEEELRQRLRDATAFAIKHRGQFTDQRVEELRKEVMARQVSRHKKGDAIGFDMDFNFKFDESLRKKELF